MVVWQSTQSNDQALQVLAIVMAAAGVGTLVLAGFGGVVVARRALAPVAQITRTASGISATDLSRRVPVEPARDELGELATTFNSMIERLESAVRRERRFTGDASHELRSPLSVIMAEASLARERRISGQEYDRVLRVVQEQAKSMQELISALLTLARAELMQGEAQVVGLRELVERAAGQVCGERDVRVAIRVPDECVVDGQPALLTRAIRNLLDNAVKASAAGAVVEVDGFCEGVWVVPRVQDHGRGIAPALWERVFEPFYQVEEARTPGDSHGLGLSICRRLTEVHGGEVRVVPCGGEGACFEMSLPASRSVKRSLSPSPSLFERSSRVDG